VSTEAFEQQIRHLAEAGYRSIGLHELCNAFSCDPATTRCVAITFDDGRRCVYEQAWPVLRKYGMRATVFVITDCLEHELYMSPRQIAEMAEQGHWFESHGVSHRRLTSLSPADKTWELNHSRHVLGQLLGREVNCFAYPFGDHDAEVRALARAAGYKAAVSTKTGLALVDSDHFALPRVGIRRQDDLARFVEKIRGNFAGHRPKGPSALLRAAAARLRGRQG
jgi:peptidoglycan/xylan/chitin deacetylase (PgdA/CDA1 family)